MDKHRRGEIIESRKKVTEEDIIGLIKKEAQKDWNGDILILKENNIREILSFDDDFDKVDGIVRIY